MNVKDLSPREASNDIGMAINNFYTLLWNGRIRANKKDGKWRIPRAEVQRIMREREARRQARARNARARSRAKPQPLRVPITNLVEQQI